MRYLAYLLIPFCLGAFTPGGVFRVALPGSPRSLVSYLAYDELVTSFDDLIFEPLIAADPSGSEFQPAIADFWRESADHRSITFRINPTAKFSDGTPVTAADVKFTLDTIQNPTTQAEPAREFYAGFKPVVVDPLTVRIEFKTPHFRNLEKLSELYILPRHFYSTRNFNTDYRTRALGSGPYRLESANLDEAIVLTRNRDYWNGANARNHGRFNFDKIVFKIIPDTTVAFESFKKGEVDYFYFLSSKMWARDTDGPLFQKGLIRKLKVLTDEPPILSAIAWNCRRPLFKDPRVRRALSLLMNRAEWNKQLFFGEYELSSGIFSVRSPYHSKKLAPLPYDPKAAREILSQAGFALDGSILKKDGVPFQFEVIANNPALQRYLNLYQQDLKRVGIQMNIQIYDRVTLVKKIESLDFDARSYSRSRDAEVGELAREWGSAAADQYGSLNFTGYKNSKLDAAAQKLDTTFDRPTRISLANQIEEILAADAPVSVTWEPKYQRVAYWDRFSFSPPGYFKYDDWRFLFQYWWFDPNKDGNLKARLTSE